MAKGRTASAPDMNGLCYKLDKLAEQTVEGWLCA